MNEMRDEPIQVVMEGSLLNSYKMWLKDRGLYLFRMPINNPDDLDTYGIGIEELHNRNR